LALKGIYWDSAFGGPRDIHVLRGQTSRRLDTLLAFELDPDPDPRKQEHASDRPFPPDVTGVTFAPIFNFTLAAHGHKVDQATGAVEVRALPANAVNVPNFIIQANVTHRSLSAPIPLRLPIRVHIHRAVTAVRLTPNPLTFRKGALHARFTVLAEFDDDGTAGRTVGDISFHPGLTWASSADSVTVDAAGWLTAKAAGQDPTITVTLPADLGGKLTSAKVKTEAEWPVGLVAQLVAGSPGWARRNEVPNVLLVAEGFRTGEKTAFELLVQKIVDEIAAATTTFPFNVLRPNMNYWSLFLTSRERGATVSNGLCYVSRKAGNQRMKALPIPAPPDAAGIQSLEHLLYQVGLPLPADRGAVFAARKALWTALYGAAHLNGLTEAIFNEWRNLADYTLALDCDTALGLQTGKDRPGVSLGKDDGRLLWFHPFRTSRRDLQPMIAGLVSSDTGEVIGPVWAGGKDERLIFALTAGPHRSGGGGLPPEGVIAGSLIEESEVRVQAVAGSAVVRTNPYGIPKTLSPEVRTLVIHETAHTLHLGDEYGETTLNLPDPSRLDPGSWNLQTEASALDPGTALDGKRVRWNWPRMSKVAVLVDKPVPLGGAKFKFRVRAGHTGIVRAGLAGEYEFKLSEMVHLRGPLPFPSKPREPFVIEKLIPGPVSDDMEVRFTGAFPPLNVDDYPSGSLVYLPTLHPTLGTELSLMWDGVRDHITTTGIPLNRLAQPCVDTGQELQSAINWPPGLPPNKPPYPSWLIGLYDGGALFHCGVFHPAGACLMRRLRVPGGAAQYPGSPYRFCAVCRYILVDVLDPTLHPLVDSEYTNFYPIP
jgi:hypothetical protein